VPFSHLKYDSAVVFNIVNHGRPLPQTSPEIPPYIFAILARCWALDPAARPTMSALALFFDVSRRVAPRRLTETEVDSIMQDTIGAAVRDKAQTTAPVPAPVPVHKRDFHDGMRFLGVPYGGDQRQRGRRGRSGSPDLPADDLSLPPPSSSSVMTMPYQCNWPGCERGFGTLGECQVHEAGHRTVWELVDG
jgi:hypothetical protein